MKRKKIDYSIKTATVFGTGSHIILEKKYLGKKVLVLPESSEYLIEDILKEYEKRLNDLKNPKLLEYLSKEDFEAVKKIYEDLIKKHKNHKGYAVAMFKKNIQSTYESLDFIRLNDVSVIIQEIGDHLPARVKKKLLSEYYKAVPSE